MDASALASIISGTVLGLGGLALTARTTDRRVKFDREENEKARSHATMENEGRRAHERELAHDARIRDDRVNLYVDLLTEANRAHRDIRARYGVGLRTGTPVARSEKVRDDDELDLLAARVTAFSSASVRGAWFRFTEALRAFRTDPAATLYGVPEDALPGALPRLGLPPDYNIRAPLEELYPPISKAYENLCETIRAETTRGAHPLG